MFKLSFIPLLILTTASFGQSTLNIDSLQNTLSEDLVKSRRLMDSILHPIKYAKSVEEILTVTFPKTSDKDARWVYLKEYGNIQKIEKRTISKILSDYKIYQVDLTNFLGYHVIRGTCLIFWDTVHSTITYAEPLWYSGVSKSLIRLFIGKSLNHIDSLLSVVTDLNELMQIGSGYKFRLTSYSDTLIKLDLGYFKGDNHTIMSNGQTSIINYNEDGIWRKIMIEVESFAIKRFTVINPKMGEKEIIE